MPLSVSSHHPASWLRQLAQQHPDRLLLETAAGRRVSYAAMAHLADRLAAALAGRGVAAGDRVAAQVEKSPEAVALYLACLRLGAVFVPLNTAYTASELEYFLSDCAPAIAIGPARDVDIRNAAGRAGVRQVETLDAVGGGSLMDLATRSPQAQGPHVADDPSAIAALLYTSGTTGRSKGAMVTRANLSSNALTLARTWGFSASDVLLHALPIFHVHGLFIAINTVLASGSSMLFLPKFDPDEVTRLLPRATVMMGVPTFYTRLLQHPQFSRTAAAKVRLFVCGSAPLLPQTHREFRDRTGHTILERYGMSETLVNTSNPYHGERIAGSVGPALPGVELRITERGSAAVLHEPDTVGMIEVRGPNVFRGYWRMPEKTAAEFRDDGFFVTGDIGRFDRDGYLYIVGRARDLIITGGYNVYPAEVEMQLDALAGIVESAVIGLPHPDFGEAVTAVAVTRANLPPDESSLRAALEQRLAKYKLPKRILFVAELPRNAMGKVQKTALREKYEGLYRCDPANEFPHTMGPTSDDESRP